LADGGETYAGDISLFATGSYESTVCKRGFGTIFALSQRVMVSEPEKTGEINVLVSEADWAWPKALRDIFRPRGVNLLVAKNAGEFVNVIERRRIHTTIVDIDSEINSLATIKIIRMDYPLLPCIILSSNVCENLLGKALELDVFSVIDKPVDMFVLQEQLNRLFIKKYNNTIFGTEGVREN